MMAFFASAAQIAAAQDTTDPNGSTQKQADRERRSPEEVVAMLDSKLSLSDDQKAKIQPIIEERQAKMRALAGSSERRRKKGREMKSIMEDSGKKINAILNEAQKKKYKEIEDQMREQAKERWHDRSNR